MSGLHALNLRKASPNRHRRMAALVVGVLVVGSVGCASGPPKTRPHVTVRVPLTAPAPTAARSRAGAPTSAEIAPAGWRYPLPAFRVDAVISHFGASRDGGARRHEGIDIVAPKGTPVLAPLDGRVIASRQQGRGGNIVVLVSADSRTEFVFAHLDRRSVSAGQRVGAGQQLGTVGNTGNARGLTPHLHFEVHDGKRPVDPYPLLAGGSRP